MWQFQQSTGTLTAPDGTLYAGGYSGHGLGVNNPSMQQEHDVGPIPVGRYAIGQPYVDPEKGPLVMRLTPDPGNEMFNRGGFLMHGDLVTEVGLRLASLGCIIEPHATRLAVANSKDFYLQVIP